MAEAGVQPALGAGSFYGAVRARHEQCGVIFTDLCHTSARKLPSHSHELAFLAILLDGLYGERYGRQERQFRPFTAHFRPAGIPHQDEIGPHGVQFFEIEIRPGWAKRLQDYSAALNVARDDCHGGPLLWLGMKLFREIHSACADGLMIECLITELLGGIVRPAEERVRQQPGWLGRIVEKLANEYSEPLTLDDLSREAGVHSVHVSRVFRRFVGHGIGDQVHRLRIRAACERMLDPEVPLAEISFATGFADQSHFTRVFRRVTGTTPAAFRSQVMGYRAQSLDLGFRR